MAKKDRVKEKVGKKEEPNSLYNASFVVDYILSNNAMSGKNRGSKPKDE